MRLSVATLVISAILVGTASAAPPPPPPGAHKPRIVTCDEARPGTKLWRDCHRKKPPRVAKPPMGPREMAPGNRPSIAGQGPDQGPGPRP